MGATNELDSRAIHSKKNEDVSHASDAAIDKGATKIQTSAHGTAHEYGSDDTSSDSLKEVFDVEGFDPVLAKKMALVNEAIDSIGMTTFQWKMFLLNGFGYAVDSVCRLLLSPSCGITCELTMPYV